MQPNFVTKAKEMGYLVGPYDSYHSIHEKSDKIGTQHPLMTHHYMKEATVTKEKRRKGARLFRQRSQVKPDFIAA